MDDPYYPCAALTGWLSRLAPPHERSLAGELALPRRLRPLLRDWPRVGPGVRELGLLVVVGEVESAHAVELAASVRVGGWLVELCVGPRNVARAVLALPPSAARQIRVGQRSVQRWTSVGLFELQQRMSTDPPDVLVTCGRRRG